MVKKNFSLTKLSVSMPGLVSDMLNAHGSGILDEIQNGIDLQEDIKGKPYKTMSPSRRRQRKKAKTGRKLLDESGRMRKCKKEPSTPSTLKYKITNIGNKKGVYYGSFHNTGDGNLPKREWFGIPKSSKPGGSAYEKRKEVLLRMLARAWKFR